MPTVGTDRQPYDAIEKYPNYSIAIDDKKLYWGNDGDVSMEYDEDGTDRFVLLGNANVSLWPNVSGDTTTMDADAVVVPVTHRFVRMAGSDTACTRTLANGSYIGQLLTVAMSDGAHALNKIDPATSYGFTSVAFSDALDGATFQFLGATTGWVLISTIGCITGAAGPA